MDSPSNKDMVAEDINSNNSAGSHHHCRHSSNSNSTSSTGNRRHRNNKSLRVAPTLSTFERLSFYLPYVCTLPLSAALTIFAVLLFVCPLRDVLVDRLN
jgi:hypothetical protein